MIAHDELRDELATIRREYVRPSSRYASETDRRRLAILCTDALLRAVTARDQNALLALARVYERGVYESLAGERLSCEPLPEEGPTHKGKATVNPLRLVSEPHTYAMEKPMPGLVWETVSNLFKENEDDRSTGKPSDRKGVCGIARGERIDDPGVPRSRASVFTRGQARGARRRGIRGVAENPLPTGQDIAHNATSKWKRTPTNRKRTPNNRRVFSEAGHGTREAFLEHLGIVREPREISARELGRLLDKWADVPDQESCEKEGGQAA